LSNYQEGQQKQAQLVQKLQQKVVTYLLFFLTEMKRRKRFFSCCKVLQYKKRCSELELVTEQQKNDIDRLRLTVSISIEKLK